MEGYGWEHKYDLEGAIACNVSPTSAAGNYPITQGSLMLEGGGQEQNHEGQKYQHKLTFSGAAYTITNAVFTTSIGNFFSGYSPGAPAYDFGARIRVTGGDITGDVFLNLYMEDGTQEPGQYGVAFSNPGGVWGAGVPTGNQSPAGQYAEGSPEYSFTVELGNYEWDESSQTLSWTTVASSAAYAYSTLGDYIHPAFSTDVPSMMVWTPTFFTIVPEPSALLLLLIGGGLISLKRRPVS